SSECFDDFISERIQEYKLLYQNDEKYSYEILFNYDQGEAFNRSIGCYNILTNSGLTPKFIEGKILCIYNIPGNYNYVTLAVIKTESCGNSLQSIYESSNKLPQNIINQIINLTKFLRNEYG